jgi:SHS2 domain-containing protein
VSRRELDHTGDAAIELEAPDAASLFQEAAGALLELFVDGAASSGPVEERERLPVELHAEDGEALLVDFLNELILLFDSERFLCARVELESIEIGSPAHLRGVLRGEPLDGSRHVPRTEVKAATFHGMKIRDDGGALSTVIVFDL